MLKLLKLFLTRHGETLWNVEKRLQGWKDSDLTENGVNNAIALGETLNETVFQAVYVSPSKRTIDTAKLIMGNKEVPVNLDERLREINMGDWEGRTHNEVAETDPHAFHAFWNAPHTYEVLKGENFSAVQRRAIEVIDHIQTSHLNGNILIVTHTVVIKCLLAYFKNLPLEKLWEPPYIHDTSLTVIEIDDQSKIILEGDISHRRVTAYESNT
jgi:broad specificity phosphatase PhoE